MLQYLREIFKRKDLIRYLVTSGLKAEHRNSYLGYAWWLLDPLLGIGIYYFLVVVVMRRGDIGEMDYAGFLVVGMVAWRWIKATVASSSRSISHQAGIISKVYLPKAIFPITHACTQLVNFCVGLLIIVIYLILYKTVPGIEILWLPFIMLVQFLFLLAIGMFVAYVSVFVRDLETAISHFMRLLFYTSPVIWERGRLPARYIWLVNLNPISAILNGYRNIFLNVGPPDVLRLSLIGGVSLAIIVFLLFYYNRNEHKIIKVL